MKKTNLFLAVFSLSALALVSCKKDEKSAVSGDTMSFTAVIGGGEKTEIYDGGKLKWTEGDSILINGKVFHSELEGEGETAVFTGEALEAEKYEAYYPVSLKVGEDHVLPATQFYDGDNLSKVNPMYAESATTDLQFYNICAMVKLVVKGEGTVTKITVSADQPLSGTFTMNKENGKYYAEVASTGASAVTLDCGGVILNPTTATPFYIALPQGDYTNLKFELSNSNDSWESMPVGMKLKAGNLRTRELNNVSVELPEGALPGVFSVSETKKVFFSKGNLQAKYNGAGYDWSFAANQWDYIGANAGNTTIKSDGTVADDAVVDLFCWSTDAPNNNWGIHTKTDLTDGYTDGDFKDWGGNVGDGHTWHTLTGGDGGELGYMFNTRGGSSAVRYAKATISLNEFVDIVGIVLVPDGWNAATYALNDTNKHNARFDSNTIPFGEWTDKLEAAGCVFLPAAGYRSATIVDAVNSRGYYWSSTYNAEQNGYAYELRFVEESLIPAYTHSRTLGFSVRLTCPAN